MGYFFVYKIAVDVNRHAAERLQHGVDQHGILAAGDVPLLRQRGCKVLLPCFAHQFVCLALRHQLLGFGDMRDGVDGLCNGNGLVVGRVATAGFPALRRQTKSRSPSKAEFYL